MGLRNWPQLRPKNPEEALVLEPYCAKGYCCENCSRAKQWPVCPAMPLDKKVSLGIVRLPRR